MLEKTWFSGVFCVKRAVQSFDPRQEMHREEFEIQHKRDRYLKNVELHHHDFFEIFYLVSGDVTYAIEGRLYHVTPGDLLLISPRELHQVFVAGDREPYERYVLWVDEKMIRRLSTEDTFLGSCLEPAGPGYSNTLHPAPVRRDRIQMLMEQIFQEAESVEFGAQMLRDSLIRQLLVELNRQMANQFQTVEQLAGSPVVEEVIRYVNLHYGEPLALNDLAEQFHVSKYHLCHAFQKQMGSGLHRYILKKRLQIARNLLSTGKKPNDIYLPCGFGDYTGFYRAFKAEYGLSPREYAASVAQDEGAGKSNRET